MSGAKFLGTAPVLQDERRCDNLVKGIRDAASIVVTALADSHERDAPDPETDALVAAALAGLAFDLGERWPHTPEILRRLLNDGARHG